MPGVRSRVLSLVVALTLAVGLVASTVGPAGAADPALVGVSSGPTQGTPVPGAYLTADLGTWQPEQPETFTFQWLRDGLPIPGATARDYLVPAADVGHLLTPEVTGDRAGYESDTITGPSLTVRKLATTTSLDVRRAHPPGKRKLVWTAISLLTTERPWATDGTLAVHKVVDGKPRVIATGPVVRGAAFVRLPWKRAPEGRTKLFACFTGSEALEASCSALDVVRRPRR